MVYSKHPDLQRLPDTYLPFGTYAPRAGLRSVSFHQLYPYTGYALEPYRTFRRLRDAGELPADARFQLSLPTSYAAIASHFTDVSTRRGLIDPWAQAMRRGYDEMLAEIPAGDLVIQLDYCIEFVDIHGDVGEDPSLNPGASREEKSVPTRARGHRADVREPPRAGHAGLPHLRGDVPEVAAERLEDLSLAVELRTGSSRARRVGSTSSTCR